MDRSLAAYTICFLSFIFEEQGFCLSFGTPATIAGTVTGAAGDALVSSAEQQGGHRRRPAIDNPPYIAAPRLFDLGAKSANRFHTERGRASVRFAAANLT